MTGEEYKAALHGILEYQVVPLLCERNAGYGSGNLLEDGHLGIGLRMKDKCARIMQLSRGDDTGAIRTQPSSPLTSCATCAD